MFETETILFSTAGKDKILVALPETKKLGGLHARFLPIPGVEVTLFKSIPNELNNGIDVINIYEVALKAEAAVQPFVVQQPLPVLQPVITGSVQLAAHPYISAEFCHVEMPVGGLNTQPFSLAVIDQSASTGFHWEANVVGPLKVADKIYPGEAIGAPGVRLFNIVPTELGIAHLHLQLIPPGKKDAVYCLNVSILAKAPVQ